MSTPHLSEMSGRGDLVGARRLGLGFPLVPGPKPGVCCVMLQPIQVSEPLAQASLEELQQLFPLPPGWSLQESFMQEARVGALTLFMVGLVAASSEQNAMGSATQADGYPVNRAYFELLERISIFEARQAERLLEVRDAHGALLGTRPASAVFPADPSPQQLRLALSNGVALHASWGEACASALHELIERDRILRSFAGELAPVRLKVPEGPLARATAEHYEAAAYEIGQRKPAPRHRTVLWFLMPRDAQYPITYGFGTDLSLDGALFRAEREAMQRLAFLWGEELPTEQPSAAATPDFHQEYYLYPANHSHLTEWLAGQYRPRHACQQRLPLFDGSPVRYVELTPPSLRGKLAVAKAVSPSARRLRFGVPAFPRDALPHPVV